MRLWQTISNLGTQRLSHTSERRRVRLINSLAISGLVSALVMMPVLFFVAEAIGFGLSLGFFLSSGLVLYCSYRAAFNSGANVLAISVTIIITLGAISKPGIGLEYVLMLVIAFSFSLFRSYRNGTLISILAVLAFWFIKEQHKASPLTEPLSQTDTVQAVLVAMVTFATLYLNSLFSKRQQDQYERLLITEKTKVEQEKIRSEKLLLNILPQETAEELMHKGEVTAKQYEQVTVLFTDFSGFTQLAEQMSAKELVEELHYCFRHFDRIVEQNRVEKIKTIGDSYMCAGGLPRVNHTNPWEVVEAGLQMQEFMRNYQAQRRAENKAYFEVRIGIHTGSVVAGIVGVKKFAYDIWGDTVNIASRMESSGSVGQVNISKATYELIKNQPGFAFTPRGKISTKGKGALAMYFVSRVDKNQKKIES